MFHKIKDIWRDILSVVFKSKHSGAYSLRELRQRVSLDIPNKSCGRMLEIS